MNHAYVMLLICGIILFFSPRAAAAFLVTDCFLHLVWS